MSQATTAAPATPDAPQSLDQFINITDMAAGKVIEIRDAEEIEGDMSLRVRVVGGGCAGFSYDLYFDNKTGLDHAFEINGVDVVVDQMSLMYLMQQLLH